MNEFGKRLKSLREERELSLSKLAGDIGSTKSALSRYENGKMEPGLSVLIKLAEYFGVTLDWLSGNSEKKNAQYVISKSYENIVNKCIKEGISPEKLNQLIDILKN